jgi:hypothetical protein
MITWPSTSLQMIADLLEGIRDRGGALVVAGENLPFAVLHHILRPVPAQAENAPAPNLFLIASKPSVNEAVT